MGGELELLQTIPDNPVWVETRGMLLKGATVLGAPEACSIVSKSGRLLSVVGEPPRAVLEEALARARPGAELLCQPEVAEHMATLLEKPGRPATIHATDGGRLHRPSGPLGESRMLTHADDLAHVPAPLRREVEEALGEVPVAAAMADGRGVAFCYPGAMTGTLWDVSIDTLEEFRRRGLATRAFYWMFDRLRAKGLLPVWGAFEDNRASIELARKLGFGAVGSLFVFEVSPPASRPA